jgi:hypothetical protein
MQPEILGGFLFFPRAPPAPCSDLLFKTLGTPAFSFSPHPGAWGKRIGNEGWTNHERHARAA